jgi:hypothetical protein
MAGLTMNGHSVDTRRPKHRRGHDRAHGCRYCGKMLPEYVTAPYTNGRKLQPSEIVHLGWGWKGNGHFCTQRCGFKFAVARLREQYGEVK